MVPGDAGLWDKYRTEAAGEGKAACPLPIYCTYVPSSLSPMLSFKLGQRAHAFECLHLRAWYVFHSRMNPSRHGFQRAKGNGTHPSLQGQALEAPAADNMFVTDHWAIFQSDTSTLPVSSKAQGIRKVGSLV